MNRQPPQSLVAPSYVQLLALPLLLVLLLLNLSHPIFVNYHITHHAGTSMFFLAKKAGMAMDGMNSIFNIVTKDPKEQLELWNSNITTNTRVWNRRSASATVLPYRRQYVSIEESLTAEKWAGFPIDFPEVHSMFIMRHPIDRLLSGDGFMPRDAKPGNYDKWFEHPSTHQYSLRWLSGAEQKETLTDRHLQIALERVSHFQHVAVQEALKDTIQFLCTDWNWTVCEPPGHARSEGKLLVDRVGNDELLLKKLEEHYLDFQLYDACVEIARKQNEKFDTPALDAIPKNLYEYEMHLLQQSLSKQQQQQQQRLRRRRRRATDSGAELALTNTTTTTIATTATAVGTVVLPALHFTAATAAAAAASFDQFKSAEFERNRQLAEFY